MDDAVRNGYLCEQSGPRREGRRHFLSSLFPFLWDSFTVNVYSLQFFSELFKCLIVAKKK